MEKSKMPTEACEMAERLYVVYAQSAGTPRFTKEALIIPLGEGDVKIAAADTEIRERARAHIFNAESSDNSK